LIGAPLILDTGGWLLALAGEDGYMNALVSARPAIVPGLVLAELDWHLSEQRREMHRVLDEIVKGAYVYEPATPKDLGRAREIDDRFRDLELGIVDASIAALAERLRVRRILTTDSDFAAVRIGNEWDRALELAVPLRGRRRRKKR
jgi:predicted nucleic acid-binding protein